MNEQQIASKNLKSCFQLTSKKQMIQTNVPRKRALEKIRKFLRKWIRTRKRPFLQDIPFIELIDFLFSFLWKRNDLKKSMYIQDFCSTKLLFFFSKSDVNHQKKCVFPSNAFVIHPLFCMSKSHYESSFFYNKESKKKTTETPPRNGIASSSDSLLERERESQRDKMNIPPFSFFFDLFWLPTWTRWW